MVPAGTHLAKAIGGKFGKAKTGTDGVSVRFKLKDSDQTIHWVGWLSPKAAERTMDTLAMLGFNEDAPLVDEGYTPAHFADKEVEVVIEHEPNEDGTKTYAKVKWVNEVGGNKFNGLASTGTMPKDLKAQLAAARARLGKSKPGPAVPEAPSTPVGEDEIPF
jgi:hypothetical protein